ncbi:MAG: S8 family serine peptidase [Synechococcales bacterium]|nr:S8 family serine peptidase [Synechococcales bacterium]
MTNSTFRPFNHRPGKGSDDSFARSFRSSAPLSENEVTGGRSPRNHWWGRSASALSANALNEEPQDLGRLEGRRRVKDAVDADNSRDIFEFQLDAAGRISIDLRSASNDLELNLYREEAPGVRSAVIDGATLLSSRPKARLRERLGPGTYFVEVSTSGDEEARYRMTLTSDTAGGRLRQAENLGTLSDEETVRGFVGDRDTDDYYRFRVEGTQTFNLKLNGLSADADVALIRDGDRNRRVNGNEIIAASVNGRSRAETIRATLNEGEYYILVRQFKGNTNYTLSLSTQQAPSGFESADFGYGLVDAAGAVATAAGRDNTFDLLPGMDDVTWEVDLVNAPEAWQRNFTGDGIVVAVLDTGVDYTHEDINDNIWRNPLEIEGNGIDDDNNGFIDDVRGWSFAENSNDPMDRDGHGTHVAGTIGAEKNNIGITGIAYDAKIMPVKVLGDDGSGSFDDITAGIYYAVDNGADVINMSLGGDIPDAAQRRAIRYAVKNGVTVVMASGNDGKKLPGFPARYATDWGIAVGAVDRNYRLADFANKAGIPLDYVVAPGVQVNSLKPGNQYERLDGTSMASPHVAGVAALMLSANPELSAQEIEEMIIDTANSRVVRVG